MVNLSDRCEICGQANPTTIEEHHKIPDRLGGPDTPENLVKLCGSCHNAIENIYDDDFFDRLLDSPERLEKTSSVSSGREIKSRSSPDREFPDRPAHVSVEKYRNVSKLVKAGFIDWDEIEELGYATKLSESEWLHWKAREEWEKDDSDMLGRFDDRITEWLNDDWDYHHLHERIEVIHCGYCNTAFFGHQRADAATHLQRQHHVEDPFVAEKNYLSDWQKQKRKLMAKLKRESDSGEGVMGALGWGSIERILNRGQASRADTTPEQWASTDADLDDAYIDSVDVEVEDLNDDTMDMIPDHE